MVSSRLSNAFSSWEPLGFIYGQCYILDVTIRLFRATTRERPFWQRLGLTISATAVALGLSDLLWLAIDRPITSPLFLAAIVFSAWFCGWRLGMVSAVLSAFLIDYFFIAPYYQLSFGFDDVARLLVFTIEGGAMCWLVEVRLAAIRRMEETQEELRALSSYQQSLREDEQKRISLEIHDELGQALTGLKMEVHVLGKIAERHRDNVPTELIAAKVVDLTQQIDDTMGTIRRIATDLRPSVLDDFGLVAALEFEANEFSRRSGIECAFNTDFDSVELSPDACNATFRVVQEALTNVARHAKASKVEIAIDGSGGATTVSVTDDGIGLVETKNGRSLGLLGMRERARLIGGTLQISRASRGGTRVQLTLARNGSLH